jgi:hypothetical protein
MKEGIVKELITGIAAKVFVGLIALGTAVGLAALGGWAFGQPAEPAAAPKSIAGPPERLSVAEAKSCLNEVHARHIDVRKRGTVVMSDGTKAEGLVYGELTQGGYKVGVNVVVLKGDIPLRSENLRAVRGVRQEPVWNAWFAWPSDAKTPTSLLACLDLEAAD